MKKLKSRRKTESSVTETEKEKVKQDEEIVKDDIVKKEKKRSSRKSAPPSLAQDKHDKQEVAPDEDKTSKKSRKFRMNSNPPTLPPAESVPVIAEVKPINPFEHLGTTSKDYAERSFNIHIIGTEALPVDARIVKPLVRVHIVDAFTGEYLKKSDPNRAVTTQFEKDVNFILPVISNPFALRSNDDHAAHWKQVLYYHESYLHIVQSNVLILFELVEFPHVNDIIHQPNDPWYCIAWAFLRPLSGNGATNTECEMRLQLYKYDKPSLFRGSKLFHSPNGPAVYGQWRDGSMERYSSTLFVSINARPWAVERKVYDRPTLVTDIETGKETLEELLNKSYEARRVDGDKAKSASKMVHSNHSIASYRSQNNRPMGQPCQLPNQPYLRLDAGTDGCYVLAYSMKGHLLAAACHHQGTYPILVYSVQTSDRVMELMGCLGLVHELSWSFDDRLLMAASSDGNVHIWLMNKHGFVPRYISLAHHCFVYSAIWHPSESDLVITGAFDHRIRLWRLREWIQTRFPIQTILDVEKKQASATLESHTCPVYALVADADGSHLFSADAMGLVKIWVPAIKDTNHENDSKITSDWICFKTIQDTEIQGIPINSLHFHPSGRKIIVHCRNRVMRVLDLRLHRYLASLPVPQSHQSYQKPPGPLYARPCFSPCGSYLLAGGHDGNVYVWHMDAGQLLAVYDQLPYQQTVSHIVFHPQEDILAMTSFESKRPILCYRFNPKWPKIEALSAQTTQSHQLTHQQRVQRARTQSQTSEFVASPKLVESHSETQSLSKAPPSPQRIRTSTNRNRSESQAAQALDALLSAVQEIKLNDKSNSNQNKNQNNTVVVESVERSQRLVDAAARLRAASVRALVTPIPLLEQDTPENQQQMRRTLSASLLTQNSNNRRLAPGLKVDTHFLTRDNNTLKIAPHSSTLHSSMLQLSHSLQPLKEDATHAAFLKPAINQAPLKTRFRSTPSLAQTSTNINQNILKNMLQERAEEQRQRTASQHRVWERDNYEYTSKGINNEQNTIPRSIQEESMKERSVSRGRRRSRSILNV